MIEDVDIYSLPEDTIQEIINKIDLIASDVADDWESPKHKVQDISRLCSKLRKKISSPAADAVSK